MEAATVEQPKEEKEPKEPKPRKENSYRILRHLEDSEWEDLGTVTASGVVNARREAVKEFGLEEDARAGNLQLVVIANRFWRPAKSKLKTSESIGFE